MAYADMCRLCLMDLADGRKRSKASIMDKMRSLYDAHEGFENDPDWAPTYLHNSCHSKIDRVIYYLQCFTLKESWDHFSLLKPRKNSPSTYPHPLKWTKWIQMNPHPLKRLKWIPMNSHPLKMLKWIQMKYIMYAG